MRVSEDYLALRSAFPDYREGEAFGVSMEDVANVLFCTPKNAKLIIKKWIELNWVRFVSGRGRGHRSELVFLLSSAAIILSEAQERVRRGDVQSAFDWLRANEQLAAVRPQFQEWLAGYFGFKSEEEPGDRVVEMLRLPIYREIVSLDPAEAVYSFDSHLIQQIYSRLVEYDASTGQFSPAVSYCWTPNEDATEWIFDLRKGVLFHDGQELTAEDVKASLLRLRRGAFAHSWLTDGIREIEILSRYRVKIALAAPIRCFLLYMSHTAASIVPARALAESETEPLPLPVGSGPYRVAERHAGKCVLEAFSSYFGYRGMMDRIEIIIVPENEAEACFGTSPGVLTVVTGEFEAPSTPEFPLAQTVTGVLTMTLNLKKDGPLQQSGLRKALACGIDRRKLVDELGEPRAYPANGFHLGLPEAGEDLRFRPEEAREVLRHAAYDGQELHLFTFGRHEPDAYWLQAQYASIGIRITVHIVTLSELIEPQTIAGADMILFEAVLSEGPIRLLEYWQSDRSFLRSSLSEKTAAEVDRLTNAFLADAGDQAEDRWRDAVERTLLESNSCVVLATKAVWTIYDRSLQGVRINARGWVDFDAIWYQQ
ncbi:ABC transporter substrate-binding protein [Cohnella lubricantis]|uniref:SgrR family transcriptional regulator n=1 Tax=Cohnella lubricantis TaxID=2163172 RepID=A0A841TEL2_9BACL|nr:ABC transporter substrate-binding protein [Cohnella lubricantis]MBB6679714.1 SgrR family transcriptional regulator [Cohnella lubricantis]MBP2119364.1 MarR-like DNA-binding transcriptional regulator SgrR of sgrS sRNA [Cohnella lubricantis]